MRETRHFPVVESKATAGKPYRFARHDVTGSDLHYLPPYYGVAVPYRKVPIHWVQWLSLVYEMATFFRFPDVLEES